ncbi:MAG: tRNA (adenosine(37)-N6)-dimethylallyltransferase MiaA [Prolixibacteraceae bacterium]|jgi:tRNA dimethylallyltransferase|nr:tRNA (adenosine(37)-N6)-dimethylallyltransferase MiaA [Prolixibacteraceae bacterium]MDI9564858.1 tRNA (adenosine(37)-N6)-dimethylallyltransferase MiaA [Bacteroidota bacterium]NLT00849.1 tRNA (adenosine(37)-N6)-dimethylallyltransferase MiaA [Bacteroidales bacterium]OQB79439.1 MAG: tRNA dimethylallyltransferase [Bacteroidetes bacterium ADurb.Bin123]HNZ69063.1 tRNA (adenosine(37)-N6)-dimethylallyltransferase MiaA [Prolixibacteraceae bacterium]
MDSTLVVIAGPTGVGKTRVSLETARHFGTEILSADSRQMYREMRIGTAVPSMEELALVRHHFIGNLSISDYYNASRYEEEAIALLNRLFRRSPVVVLTGGSMLYVDAVCNGIDDLPTIDPLIRDQLLRQYHREGIGSLRELVRQLDPEYYRTVDPDNPKRLLHALEICMMTGKPYSSFLKREKKQRSFRILKCGLNMDRKSLYEQINRRVDEMVAAGLEEEARGLLPFRSLNALNTVGYREWFSFFDGACTREETIAQIKSNTRRYARKQLTWFRRDQAITWFHPDETEKLITFIEKEIKPAK